MIPEYTKWVDEMVMAIKDKDHVAACNKPVVDANRISTNQNLRIRSDNKLIAEKNMIRQIEGKKLLPMKATIPRLPHTHSWSAETLRVINREWLVTQKLAKRTGKEWAAMIMKIKDRALRQRVACLVWWTYFSFKTKHDRWPDLDDIISEPFLDAPEDVVKIALWKIGYTPYMCEVTVSFPQGKMKDGYIRKLGMLEEIMDEQ
jgi:hypothetical protein